MSNEKTNVQPDAFVMDNLSTPYLHQSQMKTSKLPLLMEAKMFKLSEDLVSNRKAEVTPSLHFL